MNHNKRQSKCSRTDENPQFELTNARFYMLKAGLGQITKKSKGTLSNFWHFVLKKERKDVCIIQRVHEHAAGMALGFFPFWDPFLKLPMYFLGPKRHFINCDPFILKGCLFTLISSYKRIHFFCKI